MNIRTLFAALIAGIVLGSAGVLYLPGAVKPYLPESIAGKETIVSGVVLSKQKTTKALLLTVNTAQGAILATITKGMDGVDLLVGPGDTIDFVLKSYKPFVSDPKITRVIKSKEQSSEPASQQALESKETTTMKESPATRRSPAPAAAPPSASRELKQKPKKSGTDGASEKETGR